MISKKQAIRIFCFLFIVVITDQLAGYLMRKLYFTQRTGQTASLNYSLYECKADILIFGNSRAQHHYDPRIISDSLQMSCYNAGIDGGHSILLPYAQIEIILKRYTPKIIIVEFNPSAMIFNALDYEKLSVLLPYYETNPELHPLILMKSPWEKMKILSAIYPFNSAIINLIRFNTNIDAYRKWDYNGFVPIKNKQLNEGMIRETSYYASQSKAAPDKLKALEDIVQLCKDKNVKLYFINSPYFHEAQYKPQTPTITGNQVFEIFSQNKTNFIDYSVDPAFIGNLSLFADKVHLNENGATKYSQIIGGLLKNKPKINKIF